MIQRIQKWLAIRSYGRILGSKLRRRYGASRYYTPEQVKATVGEHGLNLNRVCYALCMYCDYGSFIQYHLEIGEICDYGAMQSEVAAQFSHHHASFNEVDAGGSYDTGGFDGGGSCDGGGGDSIN